MTSILKGIFLDFPKELGKEASRQVFGGSSKKKKEGKSVHYHVHNHWKAPRQKPKKKGWLG